MATQGFVIDREGVRVLRELSDSLKRFIAAGTRNLDLTGVPADVVEQIERRHKPPAALTA